MIEVDARGLSCPIPVVKVKKAIEENPGEEIAVLVDCDASRENVTRLAEGMGLSAIPEGEGGEYRIVIRP